MACQLIMFIYDPDSQITDAKCYRNSHNYSFVLDADGKLLTN